MANDEIHSIPLLTKPERLSDYAVGIFQAISSRKGIKKAIKKGWIKVDGRPGLSGDYLLGGELLKLSITEIEKPILKIQFPILYEDDHLAIINKPAGITVSGNKAYTVENALPYNLNSSKEADALSYPQAAHRLDHPTSGALIIGKTRAAVQALNKMFQSKAIHKTYLAICIGELPDIGTIESPIDDKPSITHFQLIETQSSDKYGYMNLVKLQPLTGRRHQLRKHLAEIGCPILGDKIYGKIGLILKGKGLYLHASELEFDHPLLTLKGPLTIKALAPDKFHTIFKALNND